MTVTFNDYIYNCYSSRYGSAVHFTDRACQSRTISECSPFHKYIKVQLNKDIIEIPCIYKYKVTDTINTINTTGNPVDTLYIPMFHLESDPAESKSSNPLLKKFFYETVEEINLSRKVGSGTAYLGGPGILLYDDYTPLVMLTMEVKKTVDVRNKIKLTPLKQIVRINPIIYSKDDLMAKFIKAKFLTNILNMKLGARVYECYISRKYKLKDPFQLFTDVKLWYDFKVIIEDFSDFFYIPEVPDATFSSERANEILEDNLTEILDNIR